MPSQDVASRPGQPPASVVDVEQAEAALVEHYPRLVRLAYLVLPARLGRHRRVLTAHALAQRALPRRPGRAEDPVVPGQRGDATGDAAGDDPGYAYVRARVLRTALDAGLPLRRLGWPRRAQLPVLLPAVWGLRLFPRSGGADELALEQRLSAMSGPARAAYVLRELERLSDAETRRVLAAAGVGDPGGALAAAGSGDVRGPGERAGAPLSSPEFDACSLQARPTDLMRRRQHMKAVVAAAVAALVCGALLGMPSDGWGPDGGAAPPYAQNPAGQAALDPGKLTVASPAAWRTSARRDYSVWPARGGLTGDKALLRRALAVWARPGESVQVSATPGTQAGAPPGPAHLLFAGEVDAARVVLFYDGLRIVRYAEPKDATDRAALDFARVDGATATEANAVVIDRSDGNVRYLTAPWVRATATRDLLKPDAEPTALRRSADGVTDPMAGPPRSGTCTSWNVLQVRDVAGTRLMADLGELAPARLTAGRPGSPREATGSTALAEWAGTGCSLAAMRSHGVRTVNAWAYASQQLPEGDGAASWVCTRADTWRGEGSRVFAQFRAPGHPSDAVAAQAQDSPACGLRAPQVLAGVLWKSQAGSWYLLAAGSRQVASVAATGAVDGSAQGNLLAVPAKKGAQAALDGRLTNGDKIGALH